MEFMFMKKGILLIIALPLVDISTHTNKNMVVQTQKKDMLEIWETSWLILMDWLILKYKFQRGHP